MNTLTATPTISIAAQIITSNMPERRSGAAGVGTARGSSVILAAGRDLRFRFSLGRGLLGLRRGGSGGVAHGPLPVRAP